MNTKSLLSFLKRLKANNNKEWFDAHREEYEALRKEFAIMIKDLIAEIAKFEPEVAALEPKHVLFRINRDIRFSKNKEPYKTNFGASIAPGGKKLGKAGFYLHVEPGEIFIGGGLYMPEAPVLKSIRQEIDYNGAEFRKIISAQSFKKNFGTLWNEDQLSRAPKGYPEDHPDVEYLKLKHFVAMQPLTEADLASANFVKDVAKVFKAIKPLNDFLNRSVEVE